ncbi:tRNA-modifying protein YgfZ [hydrothermal vent metagenome]|uniref:tRNA-modifying protein YgfZ n=1 Tax=hydrothermal vent metagenome TaxID=652676 RepID=A0A3B0VCN6_9ZZZZ
MSSQDSNRNLIGINSICSCIRFSGDNVLSFLNNLLISDLTILQPKYCHYTALCNPKGRIISSGWIYIESEADILIVCPTNMQKILIDFFNMRKFRLKINILPTNEIIAINNNNLIPISTVNTKVTTSSIESFYNFIFKANLPWIDADNTEEFIPQHVNLDQHENIMSFTKGCYPGQEIIARIKYLGSVKKRMVLLKARDKSTLCQLVKLQDTVSPIIHNKYTGYFLQQVIEKTN